MIDSVFRASRSRAISGLALAICFAVLPARSQTAFNPQTATTNDTELSTHEKKVIEYLLGIWGEDHSVTSVDQAMEAVGLRPSDETRFRIGQYIKQHPELSVVIRQWGWETLVLTPDEKLIARAIINAARDQKPAPALAELAGAVAISPQRVERGLVMLEKYQILKRDGSAGGVGYAVAAPRYLNWHPRLDFVFHRMAISSGGRTILASVN